ncbi:RIP metalloprotease RseP [Sneathiella glossodoripedis]|uniref:RIP metalloprotease RseP n=1 Tax=Sneathiella glossodoripedis TaxID=418853 RepID=UPI0011DD3F3C|nr:RIP metalloprotease RseP [Sneathiella glossodoripedis]
MDLLAENWIYLPAFVVVITVLVFVHEYGHYKIARLCGVKVDVFSIGFGKELFGWYDKNGCRWRISAIPFGGYVKFFGDAGVASNAREEDELNALSAEEKAVSFHHKKLWQRAAVVFAGPAANYLFAIVALCILYLTLGQAHTPAVVNEIVPQSAAEEAGLLPGDRITALDGEEISSFEELRQKVVVGLDEPILLDVNRGGELLELTITPKVVEFKDGSGNVQKIGQIGIRSTQREFREHGLGSALISAADQTWFVTTATLKGAWQMITAPATPPN